MANTKLSPKPKPWSLASSSDSGSLPAWALPFLLLLMGFVGMGFVMGRENLDKLVSGELVDTRTGFWIPHTSTIDWCEENYIWTPYIVEFWNSITTLPMVFFSMVGMKQCWTLGASGAVFFLFAGCATIGLGSVLFHGTLQFEAQQLDETPMIWTVMQWLYCLTKTEIPAHWRRPIEVFLGVHAVVFAVIHHLTGGTTGFQLYFAVYTLLGLLQLWRCWVAGIPHANARRCVQIYIGLIVFGYFCWQIDLHMCHLLRPYHLHFIWHIATFISCYYGPLYVLWKDLHDAGRKPVIKNLWLAPFSTSAIECLDQPTTKLPGNTRLS